MFYLYAWKVWAWSIVKKYKFYHITYISQYPLFQKSQNSTILATSWENLFMPYVNNKYVDQPAQSRSLISTFVVHCLDSIILLVSISEISSRYLASVAVQAGLCLTLVANPEDRGFSWRGSYNGKPQDELEIFSR